MVKSDPTEAFVLKDNIERKLRNIAIKCAERTWRAKRTGAKNAISQEHEDLTFINQFLDEHAEQLEGNFNQVIKQQLLNWWKINKVWGEWS